MEQISVDTVFTWLEEVKDPEIPVLSLVDLGIITAIQVEDTRVKVEITPTFVGCPALDMMKLEIEEKLKSKGVVAVEVLVSFKTPWSSDRITPRGRQALKSFGLAPPAAQGLVEDLDFLTPAVCPRCEGTNTELKNAFGPTLCRSIHYCYTCKEAFEQFKQL